MMPTDVVNLDNCAREPIHIPGAIQPHGLLFVLREASLEIVQVSENVTTMLGLSPEALIAEGLSAFLDPHQIEKVRFALNSVDPRDNNPVDLQIQTLDPGVRLDGFVHRQDGFSLLEVEPASIAENARFLNFYKIINKLTTRLHSARTLPALLQDAAEGVREITGFDRVMIYRFAESQEGEVVAEARSESVDSFLGLWYPASDIPEQARRLYVLNPIRAIATATYTPAAITPAINPDSNRPADLSFAGLRSVSPIHCEYLRNMGVDASMSVSILSDGALWGLIACHHLTPRRVPYELRKACTFIGQVLSGEIGRREMEAEAAYQSHATGIQSKFLELMAGSPNPLLGLVNSSPNLLDLVPCAGAAVVQGDKAHMLGETPGYTDLMKIVALLRGARVSSNFATRSLKNHFPLTENMRTSASGVIALELARDPAAYVLFFRPEVAETVVWGGNPDKPVIAHEDGFRLSPRKSFEAWKEEVRGQALPWTKSELRATGDLRNLINVVVYAKGDGAGPKQSS